MNLRRFRAALKDRRSHLLYSVRLLLLFGLYVVSGKIGLLLDPVGGFASYVWLPTGISLAALFLLGYRLWPAVFLGAFVVNFTSGAVPFVAAGIAFGNMLEALVGALLLKKFNFKRALESHKDVLKLGVLAAFFSTLFSATIGTGSLVLGGAVPFSSYFPTWFAWWVGDAISNVIVAPFIFVLHSKSRDSYGYTRIAEATFLLFAVVFINVFIFISMLGIRTSPVTYLVFPPLIWAALRFNQRVTVLSLFITSVLATLGTALGRGPFAQGALGESLYYLQSFMGIVSVSTLLLASVVSERRHLEKRKDDFISIASHELKTPLTSIKAFAQLAERVLDARGEKQASGYLKKIENQLNKLNHLVNDLLDISRIQTSRLDLKKEQFMLDSLLDEIIEEVEVAHKDHRIFMYGNAKRKIYADRERVGQVITNILLNGIKYSPNSEKISLRVKPARDKVSISIRDYGLGISKENQEKIFDLFYRVTDSYKKQPGLGIGLYLSQHIVKQHGGKIWVESKKARGSTFHVTLPVS